MKGGSAMKLWKRSLGIDTANHITASFQEDETFFGRLWPVTKQEQKTNERPRLLLITEDEITLDAGDRIEQGLSRYKTLWARQFARHTEAMMEEEDG